MKRCAIMQPTYLPWSGYFHLMTQVDVFVLLDDVQFQRRSWHTRNRILLQGREHMLTVPVAAAHQRDRLHQVQTVAEEPWRARHWATLSAAYAKAPHGRALLDLLQPLYQAPLADRGLTAWNESLIRTLAQALGIDTPLVRATTLGCGGQRSEHLLNLCLALGCDSYLSPRGSREYLEEDEFEANAQVALDFQQFDPKPYAQLRAESFVSHLSVIDVIAQQGVSFAARYVRGEA
ncbi:WbqC family protein [Aquincola tertiaricarbonis]|uniref:WbqC family protein n=1 Tax=Aquincola tertiaricarbonis TaxID=391953 RepID=A0ABY4S180_AQUTE|nr:WbqC family protein [Aquincola tertiaricarbonis]URI06325.1 WbqC family protein [Aquincola tertiaricarbonis]